MKGDRINYKEKKEKVFINLRTVNKICIFAAK